MFRLVILMVLVVMGAVFVACASSSSGGASEPVESAVNPTSEAGASAISSVAIEPENCAGVLTPMEGEDEGDLKLFRDSLTDSVKSSQPQIVSMCSAMYDTNLSGREFLSVVLIHFKSDDSAVDHYELMKSAYTETGDGLSEINNAGQDLVDVLSVLIDQDGLGRTTIMRQREWLVTVSAGPSIAESLWNVGDIEAIGRGVLERAK